MTRQARVQTGWWRWLGMVVLMLAQSVVAQPLTLVFGGDVVLDDEAGALIAAGGDPLAPLAPVFAAADLRWVNLECVVATRGQAGDKNYTFRAHPRVLPVLRRHVDGVALANNHSGDYGREAFAEMLDLLQANRMQWVGGGRNLAQAHAPWVVERSGLRLALLAYNEFMPRSFEADTDAPGVAWSEDERVAWDIHRARTEFRADVVIAILHWGWENEPTANPRQRALARHLIASGADAVIGGHPHVTQDVEIVDGKPVVYSVGNLVMKETDNERQRQAWLLELAIARDGVQGFRTHPVRLDLRGLPSLDPAACSPIWVRGQAVELRCPQRP